MIIASSGERGGCRTLATTSERLVSVRGGVLYPSQSVVKHPFVLISVFLLMSMAAILAIARSAAAQSPERVGGVLATVNDFPISALDVQLHLDLALITSNVPNTLENRQKFAGEVLDLLIGYRIQLEEAKHYGVNATRKSIQPQIDQIATNNGVASDELPKAMEAAGINFDAFVYRLQAQSAWQALVNGRFRDKALPSHAEVEREWERRSVSVKKGRSRVAGIFVRSDGPTGKAAALSRIQELRNQVLAGAQFDALARSFSQDFTAIAGGDLGWVAQGDLPDALDQAIADIELNKLTEPIDVPTGYWVLVVIDRVAPKEELTFRVDIVQLQVRPLDDKGSALERAVVLRSEINSCSEAENLARADPTLLASYTRGQLAGDLAAPIREQLPRAKPGDVLNEIGSDRLALLPVVCAIESVDLAVPSLDEITAQLLQNKLQAFSSLYLTNLRRRARIEIRS